jgi:hypothetical protein
VLGTEVATPIECRWTPPAGELRDLREVQAKAECTSCFVTASINVSVMAPRAGQGQPLALLAMERELRSLGCPHVMPKVIDGRDLLPESWFP